MKIALIDNVSDPEKPSKSGHSDIIWALARRLDDRGHLVTVVAPYNSVGFPISRIDIVTVPRRFRRTNIVTASLLAYQMAKRAKKLSADIVQVTDAFSAGAAALTRLNPVVFLVSGNVHQRIQAGDGLDKSAEWGYRFWSKLAARESVAVVCTSDDMRYWWKHTGVAQDRLHNIPLGVDTELFFPQVHFIPHPGLSILCIARLAEENNVDLVLETAAELMQMQCAFNLIVAGDGPLKPHLQEHSAQLGIADHIRWLGKVDLEDLPNLYKTADIFLFSRLYGAPPRVVLEAMSCGLPVVGFAASGVDSYVQDGLNGLLFPPGDTRAMAAGIQRLAHDEGLRQKMGRESRLLVEERYDWSVIVDQLEQLYAFVVRH